MMQAYFTGLSGMLSASSALDIISDNIANMNTPAFKSKLPEFASIIGQDGRGVGSEIAQQTLLLTAGDLNQTQSPTDMAINGQGYFILRDGENIYYTRAGQFEFDNDGFLVDRLTEYRVATLDDAGELVDINIEDMKFFSGEQTTKINFQGTLGLEDDEHVIEDLKYINDLGEEITLKVTFTRDTDSPTGSSARWNIKIETDGLTVFEDSIQFAGSQVSALDAVKTLSIPASLNGKSDQAIEIELSFTDDTGFNSLQSLTGSTNASAKAEDGIVPGGVTGIDVNDLGVIKFQYSNGETKDGPRVALAYIPDENTLEQTSGSLYVASAQTAVSYDFAGEGVLGRIQNQRIEGANQDLSDMFGAMIRVQRMYQASSRVTTMVDEAYKNFLQNIGG